MTGEKMRTIAYLCPTCRQTVVLERSEFQLLGSRSELPCPCGKSAVTIDPEGDRVHLTIPCLVCGTDHDASCSAKALCRERALAFSCPQSGLDCCYIGEAGPVVEAMRRLEEAADKLEDQAPQAGTFLDEIVMTEVLSELKDIAARDGISCSCGSHRWSLKLGYSAIDVICGDCGGTLRLPAATASDLEDICCKTVLRIKGR